MKGIGAARRALISIATRLTGRKNFDPSNLPAVKKFEERQEIKRTYRRRARSNRHPKTKGVRVTWASKGQPKAACHAPLSRTQLKRLCPGHPLVKMGWR